MSTPKLYKVSVTYEVLVAAGGREESVKPAKALLPPGTRLVSWTPVEAKEGDLTSRERGTIPLLAAGVENPDGHTAEKFAQDADAERALAALKRQPRLPGI